MEKREKNVRDRFFFLHLGLSVANNAQQSPIVKWMKQGNKGIGADIPNLLSTLYPGCFYLFYILGCGFIGKFCG